MLSILTYSTLSFFFALFYCVIHYRWKHIQKLIFCELFLIKFSCSPLASFMVYSNQQVNLTLLCFLGDCHEPY